MNSPKKIYFASDTHFGTPNATESLAREKEFIAWLNQIQHDAKALYLVGDIFDFWFDYKTVVPKGFVRLLGKLAELSDKGIAIHYFKGNHDMWLDGYFKEELGFTIHSDNYIFEENGFRFFIGHGDGKGPKDTKYKLLKKVFRNPFFIFLFRWLHPDIGTWFAQFSSKKSRYAGTKEAKKEVFFGEDKEWLVSYAKRKLEEKHYDFFIFGHRHLALDIALSPKSKYINLGDWLHYKSYAVFDGEKLTLNYFQHNEKV